MRKIDQFTNQYSVSKTLRFKLIPQGKTEENFEKELLLASDEKRAEDYTRVKKLMDGYHKQYIDKCLSGMKLDGIQEYAALYYKSNRTPDEKDEMEKLSAGMIKEISKCLKSGEEYPKLFKKEMIEQILPGFVTNDEDREAVQRFKGFTTYFQGFYDNRENIYTGEGKSTEAAYRLIVQNLPKFLDNCKNAEIALSVLDGEAVKQMANNTTEVLHADIRELCIPEAFTQVITQNGIDTYNQLLGGYTTDDGRKIQGINELINLSNQQKHTKLALLKPLYKQILSDRSSVSFIPDAISSDSEMIDIIRELLYAKSNETGKSLLDVTAELKDIVSYLDRFNAAGIFVKSGTDMTGLSKQAYGDWQIIQSGLENRFEAENPSKKKDSEAYAKKRDAYIKHIKSLSLAEMDELAHESGTELASNNVVDVLKTQFKNLHEAEGNAVKEIASLLQDGYSEDKSLKKDEDTIEKVKTLLDSIMEEYHFLRKLQGNGDEGDKDDIFYGQVDALYNQMGEIVPAYNKIRNYVTSKDYNDSKIKLNFETPQLMAGWDVNKEPECRSLIFRKGDKYYLGVMSKQTRYTIGGLADESGASTLEKMIYKQIPSAAKYFSSKQINPQNPPAPIREYLSKDFDKKTMSPKQLTELIKYVADDFIPNYESLHDRNGDCYFSFKFRPYGEYKSWREFCDDIDRQSYAVKFVPANETKINEMVENGELFLFQLYNKDFSEYSKGTPNLHTLYFKALFDEDNLDDPRIALNGGAEMFYRKASINRKQAVVHKAGEAIANKNPDNPKKTSTFEYDLIKDRRYTERQFELHFPIKLNSTAPVKYRFNERVRKVLKEDQDTHIIGIDRGERNLVYVSVINGSGEIVEQFSMNTIVDENGTSIHRMDYHRLLDEKEKGRKKARQDWKTIENISNIKEGYISQVVHRICELVEKYDAIIAMEDLNGGFKNSRAKVEKQVYQKFEKMLIDKLNYMADKKKPFLEPGGVMNAYQLTEKFESFAKMRSQNGFIFYIPAWLTSKLDPTTGFVDLLKPKYESIENSKKFIGTFRRIEYNEDRDWFEFDVNYDDFPKGKTSYRKEWTLISYGNRIRTFRNPQKNNEFDSVEINLTDEFKKLLEKYGIDMNGDIQAQIMTINEKEFFVDMIKCIALMLQMRNSISGTDVDYLISPVMNSSGSFYCSDDCDDCLPCDADANGAYNIARKALWAVQQIKDCESDNLYAAKISISNAEWLEYTQRE